MDTLIPELEQEKENQEEKLVDSESKESEKVKEEEKTEELEAEKEEEKEKESEVEQVAEPEENPDSEMASDLETKFTSGADLLSDLAGAGDNFLPSNGNSGSGSSACSRACGGPCLSSVLCPRAWFNPEKLHPTVGELVYWRDPKKSGIVFGALLVILLALTSLSLISVVAYTSLTVLTGTLAFRVYKSVLQAVQKTQDGHPFKEYLDLDLAVSNEKAQEVSTAVTNYLNATAAKLRSLFLVEDIVESAKFGVALYLLTYIGAWFNGLTLVILGLIALFAAPKVYETNKTIIDQYLDLVQAKISEISTKITTAVPFLAKKDKAQ